jgi:hypothetical protein
VPTARPTAPSTTSLLLQPTAPAAHACPRLLSAADAPTVRRTGSYAGTAATEAGAGSWPSGRRPKLPVPWVTERRAPA